MTTHAPNFFHRRQAKVNTAYKMSARVFFPALGARWPRIVASPNLARGCCCCFRSPSIYTSGSNEPHPLSALLPTGADPLQPLAERPAIHEHALSELASWHSAARARVASAPHPSPPGASGFEADGGASAPELRRELDWLLDDAVADVSSCSGSGSDWKPTTWAQLRLLLPSAPARPGEAKREASWPPPLAGSGSAPPRAASEGTCSPPGFGGPRVRLRASLLHLWSLWDGARLGERVPLQQITGAAHWRGMVLSVSRDVLIPRPVSLRELKWGSAHRPLREASARA